MLKTSSCSPSPSPFLLLRHRLLAALREISIGGKMARNNQQKKLKLVKQREERMWGRGERMCVSGRGCLCVRVCVCQWVYVRVWHCNLCHVCHFCHFACFVFPHFSNVFLLFFCTHVCAWAWERGRGGFRVRQFVCLLCFIDTFDLAQCALDSFIMCARTRACRNLLPLCAPWLIHGPHCTAHPPPSSPPFPCHCTVYTPLALQARPPLGLADVICWQMSYNNVTLSVHHNKIIRRSWRRSRRRRRSQGWSRRWTDPVWLQLLIAPQQHQQQQQATWKGTWKELSIRLRLDWSLNWLTSLWQAWATHCLTFQDAPQPSTNPPPLPPLAWRTQMKSCLSWPPNVSLVMKCALIWSPVECISRRQQAEGSRNLRIGIGNRQLASSAIWYHKSSIAACMTGRKGAFCAASHSNDMPKAKVACCTLPQAGYIHTRTVYLVYTRDPHECIHCALDSTTQLGTAFLLHCTWNECTNFRVPTESGRQLELISILLSLSIQ